MLFEVCVKLERKFSDFNVSSNDDKEEGFRVISLDSIFSEILDVDSFCMMEKFNIDFVVEVLLDFNIIYVSDYFCDYMLYL